MKLRSTLFASSSFLLLACSQEQSMSQELHGSAFSGAAPDETHPWAVHDRNRPQPPRVEPGSFSSQDSPGTPPSDAIILFDGTPESIANWVSDRNPEEPTDWIVEDGALLCVPGSGYIRSKEEFGDVQLHIEWAAPSEVQGNSQGRGNSGVFLMGMTEVQVLDNYENPTYADGFAGSVYGVNPPMANPLHKPGEWQTYDIVFRRPIFKDGVEIDPGYLTVFVNGVLVQDHTPLEGGGGHMRRSQPRAFPDQGPLKLQDHGNPVRFRNIWLRPLPARAIEGGTDGQLTPEATMAKRAEIAAGIREHAATLEGRAHLFRLMESLVYQHDDDARSAVDGLTAAHVAELQALSDEQREQQKGAIREFERALHYLANHQIIPGDYPARVAVDALVEAAGWNEK